MLLVAMALLNVELNYQNQGGKVMEAALATFTVWFIIGLIVFILIIVAIIGTWFEAREMRKELEQVNAYLATLNDNMIIGFQNNDRQSRNF